MSDLRIYEDIEQGSDQWRLLRCGLPTASEFKSIMAKGQGKTRRAYLYRLAGEKVTGEPAKTFENHNMVRGREMEAEARNFYALMTDAEPKLVGFIRNGNKGASPDALLGNDGLLEIKTSTPALLIDLILKDKSPAAHWSQVQGQLWVSEREWCDLVIYWPKLPLFVRRIARDEDYIKALSQEVAHFNDDLAEVVEKIQQYGGQAAGEMAKPQLRPAETVDMSEQPTIF